MNFYKSNEAQSLENSITKKKKQHKKPQGLEISVKTYYCFYIQSTYI